MFKKLFSFQTLITLALSALVCVGGWGLAPVFAASTTLSNLPVALNATETITFSDRQLAHGKMLFNGACGRCHVGGQTYPNPDVSLRMEDLEGATPPRNTVLALVDYAKNPLTYDGAESLVEYHPNTQLTTDYPRMRNLSDDDLKDIAGYILVSAKTIPGWGGTKSESHSDLAGYL